MSTFHERPDADGSIRLASRPHPTADHSWYAAQKLAHEEWHAWAMDEAEKARLLAESKEIGRGERTGRRPGWFSVRLRSLRRTIGAALIGAGRRVQGTAVANLPEGTAR